VSVPARVLLIATLSFACSTERAAPRANASVEGDMYLVMQNGDTKRGAGRTVYLLEDSVVHASVERICNQFTAGGGPLLVRRGRTVIDSLNTYASDFSARYAKARDIEASGKRAYLTMMRDVSRAILGAVRDTASTGINAHFLFPHVPPGRYALYSEMDIGTSAYRWLVSVNVTGPGVVRRDLDNSVEGSTQLYCGVPPES
jgi:hypothetical protein